jgi:hypothetical protein
MLAEIVEVFGGMSCGEIMEIKARETCKGNVKPTFLCLRLSYVYNVSVERRSRVVM